MLSRLQEVPPHLHEHRHAIGMTMSHSTTTSSRFCTRPQGVVSKTITQLHGFRFCHPFSFHPFAFGTSFLIFRSIGLFNAMASRFRAEKTPFRTLQRSVFGTARHDMYLPRRTGVVAATLLPCVTKSGRGSMLRILGGFECSVRGVIYIGMRPTEPLRWVKSASRS